MIKVIGHVHLATLFLPLGAPLERGITTYKVGEEVSGLAHPELVLVAEPRDEVDVGLDPRWVGLWVS